MSTKLKIEELPQELAALFRRMHERDECIVVIDDKGPVAYLNLAFRPDLKQWGNQDFSDFPIPEPVPRVSCDNKGRSVVNCGFGKRLVTEEEIYEELRGGGFP